MNSFQQYLIQFHTHRREDGLILGKLLRAHEGDNYFFTVKICVPVYCRVLLTHN